ncbi:bifunctional phosphopantothenoylcysteine decarboxylase/phosphopantothenate--cysteine ligase CoaBC [Pseudomaricurvus alkylphenolicus]|jgi:phosphopantothenoylcysteine decarboxylase/phosphopantothenate--cysteine ligase|uniref:bifunctional phosphopantothenoylcysteine decarboxylase/phosphopantothenate--cysteine ligase CoaBC n=1 Tax=Pseudomaricurvus alkylphenolicus TaxID=1306991 RepID=UPI001422BF34|nr:bifunctional phosphopantothenoylcysteine decarboxylase/phosphopantothenate--cysteine ligase CoaBC [Pseudomaricurvus alkylphenolicus]NIB39548.1 bifunctional phosphopantothenoylcysteine decarboxylase/phosphopantothenate--cysteine ligase CoaBC [Pseudomaricurvus alkylphenolicus]
MSSLTNKQILLGVTGGIAAYKSAELIRRLQDQGASVRVIMTPAAQEFITPLTLQALSGNPVHTTLLDPEAEAGMGHIELARWADLLLVAPASADFIARLVQGQGDDLLTTACLATPAPLCLAPAMNQGMWSNLATQDNLKCLAERGIRCFGPAEGSQACGDVGPGRMLEPDQLVELAAAQFESGILAGRSVVITAGPTREAIDPVRYISNHSSGKMGYALAEAARDAGARVTLISGPTRLPEPERCRFVAVDSAEQMYQASLDALSDCDMFIASAAVADYRPANAAEQKIKKTGQDTMVLELVKNPDIVTAVAASDNRPFTVGFAAETQDVTSYARDKLVRKKLDVVIANDVSRGDIGFNSDDNEVTIVWPENEESLSPRSKTQLARDLIVRLAQAVNSD